MSAAEIVIRPATAADEPALGQSARGTGIGERLVEAAADWLSARDVPRVMLWTAEKNAPAQRLFERLGFRPTMIKMTWERARS